MTIRIYETESIKKLLAFLSVRARAKFEIDSALFEDILDAIQSYAKANNVSIEIVDPSRGRIAFFCKTGFVAGATFGYLVASVPGCLAGAAIGTVAGYGLARVKIQFTPPKTGDGTTFLMQTL